MALLRSWIVKVAVMCVAWGWVAPWQSAGAAAPDVSIELPLQGYFHPGRYMPVHVRANLAGMDDRARVLVERAGAARTDLQTADHRVDCVAPWLAIDDRTTGPTLKIWPDPGAPIADPRLELRPLSRSDALVAYVGNDSAIANQLLPGRRIVAVRLDGANPLPGAPASWETLDALILDAASATAAIPNQLHLQSLVSAGMAIAIKAPSPPFAGWPWRKTGDYWVLRSDTAGPFDATYIEEAYRPVRGRKADWPVVMRRQAVLLGVIFAILLAGLLLVRPRPVALWAVLFCGASIGGVWGWGKWYAPVVNCGGSVMIMSPGMTQVDTWVYTLSTGQYNSQVRWAEITKPVFKSEVDLQRSNFTVQCYPNGQPLLFSMIVPPHGQSALLSRAAGPRAPQAEPKQPITSPLQTVLTSLYTQTGDQILGELPAAVPADSLPYQHFDLWPTIVIKREAK